MRPRRDGDILDEWAEGFSLLPAFARGGFLDPLRDDSVATSDPQGLAPAARPRRLGPVAVYDRLRARHGHLCVPKYRGNGAGGRSGAAVLLPDADRGSSFRPDLPSPRTRSEAEGARGPLGGRPGSASSARRNLLRRKILSLFWNRTGPSAHGPLAFADRYLPEGRHGNRPLHVGRISFCG